MPPLQALAALHGLWALVLAPPIAWALRRWPPQRLRLLGSGLTALGLLGFGIVAGRELFTWLPAVSPEDRPYILQRILFALVTLTDIPLVQLTGAGLVCWMGGARRKPAGNAAGLP